MVSRAEKKTGGEKRSRGREVFHLLRHVGTDGEGSRRRKTKGMGKGMRDSSMFYVSFWFWSKPATVGGGGPGLNRSCLEGSIFFCRQFSDIGKRAGKKEKKGAEGGNPRTGGSIFSRSGRSVL